MPELGRRNWRWPEGLTLDRTSCWSAPPGAPIFISTAVTDREKQRVHTRTSLPHAPRPPPDQTYSRMGEKT